MLGLTSAIIGVLFAGIFDHHFFDTEFPHFATLYWVLMGLAVAGIYVGEAESGKQEVQNAVFTTGNVAEHDSSHGREAARNLDGAPEPTTNPIALMIEGARVK